MKRGESYYQVSDKTNPKHPLVKTLLDKGYKDFKIRINQTHEHKQII
jgi:hypothetical protein